MPKTDKAEDILNYYVCLFSTANEHFSWKKFFVSLFNFEVNFGCPVTLNIMDINDIDNVLKLLCLLKKAGVSIN